MKKLLIAFIVSLSFLSATAQTGAFNTLQVYNNLTLKGHPVYKFSNDTAMILADSNSLPTAWAVKKYFDNRFSTLTIATGNTYVISSQSAMLALSATVGDVAVRSDSSKSFILQALPASTLGNWILLLFPNNVPTVFGRTGAITAQTGDYNYSQISGTPVVYIQAQIDSMAAIKANDSTVVHKTGTETVTGAKTFTQPVYINGTAFYPNYILPVGSDFTMNAAPGYDANVVASGSGKVKLLTGGNDVILDTNKMTYSKRPHLGPSDSLGIYSKAQTDSLNATREAAIIAGTASQYWRGDKTWQTLPTPVDSAFNKYDMKLTGARLQDGNSYKFEMYNAPKISLIADTFGLKTRSNVQVTINTILQSDSSIRSGVSEQLGQDSTWLSGKYSDAYNGYDFTASGGTDYIVGQGGAAGHNMVIERRFTYDSTKYYIGSYPTASPMYFQVIMNGFPPDSAQIHDKYLNTYTPINPNSTTYYAFTVDGNSASTGQRFTIVYTPKRRTYSRFFAAVDSNGVAKNMVYFDGNEMKIAPVPSSGVTGIGKVFAGAHLANTNDSTLNADSLSNNLRNEIALKANDTGTVHKSGTEIITGAKTIHNNLNVDTTFKYQYGGYTVISAQPLLFNYFFGGSGNLAMSGSENVAMGDSSLKSNTTGYQNVAIGREVLFSNTTGRNNTAEGYQTLFTNTTGKKNVANGYQALYNNNGDFNTAIGASALLSNTTGATNTAIGNGALYSNTTGNFNTSAGGNTLFSNTSGYDNMAYGDGSLNHNTVGHQNNGYGSQTLYLNTIGNDNTIVGFDAAYSDTSANGNSAVGNFSMFYLKDGNYNAALGFNGLYRNKHGNYNIGLGYNSNGTIADSSVSGTFYISDSTPHMKYKYLDSAIGTAPSIIGKDANGFWHVYATPSGSSYTFSTGLTNTAGTVTANLVTGLAGGQTIKGGTGANESLTINGTTNATKTTSYVIIQPTGGNVAIGLTVPTATLNIQGIGSTSATTSFLVQNSALTNLFKIRDDGLAQIQGNTTNTNRSDWAINLGGGLSVTVANTGTDAFGFYAGATLETYITGGGNLTTLGKGYFGSAVATTTPPSTLTSAGSFGVGYVAKATSYTATINDFTIEVTATGQTMTLPTAVGITGRIYTIKLTAAGSSTIATTSSQTIDAATTYTLSAQYKYVTVQSNGANWNIIANN